MEANDDAPSRRFLQVNDDGVPSGCTPGVGEQEIREVLEMADEVCNVLHETFEGAVDDLVAIFTDETCWCESNMPTFSPTAATTSSEPTFAPSYASTSYEPTYAPSYASKDPTWYPTFSPTLSLWPSYSPVIPAPLTNPPVLEITWFCVSWSNFTDVQGKTCANYTETAGVELGCASLRPNEVNVTNATGDATIWDACCRCEGGTRTLLA
eukprot:scaffold13332_cov275-Alexandrium_tamarense.AAC.1